MEVKCSGFKTVKYGKIEKTEACGNIYNLEIRKGKAMFYGRDKKKSFIQCINCKSELTVPENEETNKTVMYVGFRNDNNAAFVSNGLEFSPRVVYPASDEVFDWAKHQNYFITGIIVSNSKKEFKKNEVKNE